MKPIAGSGAVALAGCTQPSPGTHHKTAVRRMVLANLVIVTAWMMCVSGMAAEGKGRDPSSKQTAPEYARDVLPILSDHCFSCHGPDENSREAELRLDLRADAIRSIDGVAPIVPGQPNSSEMLRRINASDTDLVMPPPDALKPLSAAQKLTLKRWIESGAPYAGHWAFTPPQRVQPPAVDDSTWPHNAIDRFVLHRLQSHGLQPSPAADRQVWLRRVTLDLTGLPPTLDELNAFLSDDSEHAKSRVVDRLQETEAHAERMAMSWLDAARYADTNGYNNDEVRTMWPWRDWVINAFRSGMPYDQFLTEQLAGDLLPNPSISQRVATGFNRNHVLTTEGGIIPEEYQAEYVADRVHTTATIFMGISLRCARCHDHKFDPLSQRDFYRFAAYFNNIPDTLVSYNSLRMADPVLKVPSAAQQRQLDLLHAQQEKLQAELAARAATVDVRVSEWETTLTPEVIARLGSLGLIAKLAFDEAADNRAINTVDPTRSGTIHGRVSRQQGRAGTALDFDGSTYVDAGQIGSFDSESHFSLAAWIRPTTLSAGAVVSKMDDANAYRGYDLLFMDGKLSCHVVHHWPDKAIKVVTKNVLPVNEWHHVAVTYDGTRQASGLRVYVNGVLQEVEVANDKPLDGPITTDKPFHIGKRHASIPFHGLIDEVHVFNVTLSVDEAAQLAEGKAPQRLSQILAVAPDGRTDEQRGQLRTFFSDRIDERSQELRQELSAIPAQLDTLEQAIPVTMIMQEMQDRRPTHILIRGQYDKVGERVEPGLPASLLADPQRPSATRLDMANWLTDPSHPLTARVAVNRWWEMLFGTGLVETVEDFGVQGAGPSHPELLDWLATELIRQNWDQRAIIKLIVLSSSYGQSSDVSPELLDADPNNRLMSRGPRWRLPAEMIRDNALAISGLLEREVGGPSVRPYQPAGLWEDVSVLRRDKYVPAEGPGLYRRSMYTFWKRTCPPPSMSAFDAPDRETCVARRARTNTPLQALVLLNDVTYVEAARAFAQQVTRHSADDKIRLDYAFRTALARRPSDQERTVVLELLATARARFLAHPNAATELLSVGFSQVDSSVPATELAAWTSVTSILLNLDETISKP